MNYLISEKINDFIIDTTLLHSRVFFYETSPTICQQSKCSDRQTDSNVVSLHELYKQIIAWCI